MASPSEEEPKTSTQQSFCRRLFIKDTQDATGAGFIRIGNGPVLMSNVFLATAFLTLAQKEIGCYHEDDDIEHDECDKVYGFKPSSLITLIGTVSGVLTALFLPFIGAIVDCTSYRRAVGYISGTVLIAVQAIQIGTNQSTWFPMVILQAINGFIYLVQTLAAFSYYPEIAREVGSTVMTGYLADYQALTFGNQLLYLIVVTAISLGIGLDDVQVAMLGQGLCVVISGSVYYLGWKRYFTQRPAARILASNESLAFSGFAQVFRTFGAIFQHYKSSLGYFLLAVMFGQAGANAFTTVAVTYLVKGLKFSGSEIGIIFIVVLFCTLPGSYLGAYISKRTTPKVSVMVVIMTFICANFAGFLLMKSKDDQPLAYLFGAIWGTLLGWFYPTESLIFSLLMPKGQESELAGFYLYCGQIISWLPPLIFTVMNEADVSLSWAGIHLNIYFFIAGVLYMFMLPWDKCVDASKVNKMKHESTIELSPVP